jgi:hypothetical protein
MIFKKRKITCPKGGHTDNIIPIEYGMPTREAAEEEKEGKIMLGGCCEEDDSPQHYCKTHKIKF